MTARGLALLSSALVCIGCGPSYDAPSGKEEPITVEYSQSITGATQTLPAQFFQGDFQAGSGPQLFHPQLQNHTAIAGGPVRTLDGDAAPAAYSVAMRLKNAGTGYYLIKVNLPDANDVPNLNWTAKLHFTDSAPLGDQTLIVAALDKAGQFGPITEEDFTVLPPISLVPPISKDADTVVSLVWGTRADLDLRIGAPGGNELDPDHPHTVPVAEIPSNYNPVKDGPIPGDGALDHDANKNCVYDGVIRENVTFADPPAPGVYQFRVDEFSSCGVAASTFRVEIYHQGRLSEAIAGQLLDINADGGGLGSGLFVGARCHPGQCSGMQTF